MLADLDMPHPADNPIVPTAFFSQKWDEVAATLLFTSVTGLERKLSENILSKKKKSIISIL